MLKKIVISLISIFCISTLSGQNNRDLQNAQNLINSVGGNIPAGYDIDAYSSALKSQTLNGQSSEKSQNTQFTPQQREEPIPYKGYDSISYKQDVPIYYKGGVPVPYKYERPTYYRDIRDGNMYDENGVIRLENIVFGREIFFTSDLNFSKSHDIATPFNYILGPGDKITIEIWGASEKSIETAISPEGTINISGIGPVHLSGFTVEQAQGLIASKVSSIMGNSKCKLSVGQVKTIKVNIVGEVMAPGTYSLSSFSTVINALYHAKGISDIGSLREINVYRNSKLVSSMDIYEYLINGNYEANIMLQDNDEIIVPPYHNQVKIAGEVKRARIYEIKQGESIQTLIKFAGGFTGDAYSSNLSVFRKTDRMKSVATVSKEEFGEFEMNNGDSVNVGKIIDDYNNRLILTGSVMRPGTYELSDKLNTLSQLIEKAEGLKGNEFASRGQIVRRNKDYTYSVIPFNVSNIVNGQQNIELLSNDSISIPNKLELRQDYFIVSKGELLKPGKISYFNGMTVEDAIISSGGLKESASLARVEVARRVKSPNSTTYTDTIAIISEFGITKDLDILPEAARFVLEPFDEIYVRRSPGYSEQNSVKIAGEVLFPGEYVIATSGERISDILARSGGATVEAYLKGASVLRQTKEEDEARKTSALVLEGKDSTLLGTSEKRTMYPIGVDVQKAFNNPRSNDDIILQDGDQLFVPKYSGVVSISGSVLYPNSVAFEGGKAKDYVSQAGGYNYNSRKRPYVVYMNGKVASTRGWFVFKISPKVEPGCEIIVPSKRDKRGSAAGLANTMSIMSSLSAISALGNTINNVVR